MVGSPDGLREKVKMDPSATWEGIGKHENKENGMDAPTYSENSMKTPLKAPDLTSDNEGIIKVLRTVSEQAMHKRSLVVQEFSS